MYDSQQLGEFLRSTTPQRDSNEYLVQVGDRLDVVFFFHQDLTTSNLLVRSDGRITLPYVGDLMAAGRTPMQLDSVLTTQFAEILKDPNLSVIVVESRKSQIYVVGQVDKPGGYRYDHSITLLQAIALAGGLSDGASQGNVLVMRRSQVSTVVGVEVDLKSIMKGESIQNDFPLRDEDVVFVPKTKLHAVGDYVKEIDRIIASPSNLIIRALQLRVSVLQLEPLRSIGDTE